MATIIYNGENIADAYAPSLNAAFVQVYRESGIQPRVIAPYGAWSSPAIDSDYGIKGRTSSSDHYKGRAVDIANYLAIEAVIGRARLKAIMAAYGWLNVQNNGSPFPTEPWHFANRSSAPAGSTGIPLPTVSTQPAPTLRHGRRKSMLPLLIHDGAGRLGPKNAVRTYIFGPGLWRETTGEPSADLVSLILIGTERSGNYFDTPNLTYGELYAYARDSGALTDAQLAPYKAAAGL